MGVSSSTFSGTLAGGQFRGTATRTKTRGAVRETSIVQCWPLPYYSVIYNRDPSSVNVLPAYLQLVKSKTTLRFGLMIQNRLSARSWHRMLETVGLDWFPSSGMLSHGSPEAWELAVNPDSKSLPKRFKFGRFRMGTLEAVFSRHSDISRNLSKTKTQNAH